MDFLSQAYQNYFDGITPGNKDVQQKKGYIAMVDLAREFFDEARYEDFSSFFIEGEYFISLWAAHMLIEYGNPPKRIFDISVETIKSHSNNTYFPKVAQEEKNWLIENEKKYGLG